MNIHAISTGLVKVKQNQISRADSWLPAPLPVLTGSEWSDWLPIYAWVIEHPEGTIVVDTGETARTSEPGYFPAWHPYFRLAVQMQVMPEQEIGPQLRRLSIDPTRDVRRVLMTHLHTDHAGGLAHFPNSEIWMDQREFQASRGLAGKAAGYLPHRMPRWLAPRFYEWTGGPFGPFPHSHTITEDGKVRVVPTPGHSPGHASVVVEHEDRFFFLAGDTSYTEENLVRGIADGVSAGQVRQTMQQIQAFCTTHPTVYLPSHDPASAARLAEQRVVSQERLAVDG